MFLQVIEIEIIYWKNFPFSDNFKINISNTVLI